MIWSNGVPSTCGVQEGQVRGALLKSRTPVVLDGELLAGRQALEGQRWPLELRRLSPIFEQRHTEPREPLPDRVANHVPDSPVSLDSDLHART